MIKVHFNERDRGLKHACVRANRVSDKFISMSHLMRKETLRHFSNAYVKPPSRTSSMALCLKLHLGPCDMSTNSKG